MELSNNQTLIDCKWVYKLKKNTIHDKNNIFKVKLMIRGFTQKNVNYNKNFSPITNYATICLESTFVTIFNLSLVRS